MLSFVETGITAELNIKVIPLIDWSSIIINWKIQEWYFDKQKEVELYKEFRKSYYEGYNQNTIDRLQTKRNANANENRKRLDL